MAKKHPRAYPLEFRSKIVELARAGRRPEDLASEFELSNQTIRNWIRQADLDAGKRTDGLTSEERSELFMLRKKVKQLTIEREILSKAAVGSTGRCNAPIFPDGGVANGSAWTARTLTTSKGRALESLESGRIAERHCQGPEKGRWFRFRCASTPGRHRADSSPKVTPRTYQ
jgi:transposase